MSKPRVMGLSGFGLEVPNPTDAEKFYGTFGLTPEYRGGTLVLGIAGRNHEECLIVKGSKKKLHHVSFFIKPEDRQRFADELTKFGLDVKEEAPKEWLRSGLWFQDPWGTWINLTPEVVATPEVVQAHPSNFYGKTNRIDVHLWRELDKARQPLRIGHMLIFTPEWEKAEDFYSRVLGLRTSDRAAGKVAFMAAGDGVTDHHCFGLIKNTHRGFQHASFQVAAFDDIGFGAWRMKEAGYKETFGPGRHSIASNLFHYIRDPWGSWVEYYTDMDKISTAWQARDFRDLPYVWGPEWSPEFWTNEMNANFEATT